MKNIIFGVIAIIMGASGQFVLRGTNSSGLLVVVGIGLLFWGIIQEAGTNGGSASGGHQRRESAEGIRRALRAKGDEKEQHNWLCKSCSMKNPILNKECSNCGTSRF